MQHINHVISFILELEKLKGVERKSRPVGLTRFENAAEHSWQIALLAVSLLPYAREPLDALKVIKMLLIHDVVEIDTGDKFAYSSDHDDYENELQAAKRIFALLPSAIADELLILWQEFEHAETAEARFAKGIDRAMPVLQNLHNGGQSWVTHGVSISQILEKNAMVAAASPELWEYIKSEVVRVGQQLGLRR